MKKGSDWAKTWHAIEHDKDIKRLARKIEKIALGHDKYFIAGNIMHYILNYYDIKRKK